MKIIFTQDELDKLSSLINLMTSKDSPIFESPLAVVGLSTAKEYLNKRGDRIFNYFDSLDESTLELEISTNFGNSKIKASEVLQILINSIQ